MMTHYDGRQPLRAADLNAIRAAARKARRFYAVPPITVVHDGCMGLLLATKPQPHLVIRLKILQVVGSVPTDGGPAYVTVEQQYGPNGELTPKSTSTQFAYEMDANPYVPIGAYVFADTFYGALMFWFPDYQFDVPGFRAGVEPELWNTPPPFLGVALGGASWNPLAFSVTDLFGCVSVSGVNGPLVFDRTHFAPNSLIQADLGQVASTWGWSGGVTNAKGTDYLYLLMSFDPLAAIPTWQIPSSYNVQFWARSQIVLYAATSTSGVVRAPCDSFAFNGDRLLAAFRVGFNAGGPNWDGTPCRGDFLVTISGSKT